MRRYTFCFLLALCVTLLIASPASAGRRWCARDPIVTLDGHALQVWVAIPAEFEHLVNGPIDVQFTTPAGMSRSVVLTDDGFNGYGEVVSFADDSAASVNPHGAFTVRVWVAVPISDLPEEAEPRVPRVPVQITIVEGDSTNVFHGWSTGMSVVTRVNEGHTAAAAGKRG